MNLAPGFQPPSAGSSGPGAGSGAALENLEKQLICPGCLEMFSKPVVILPCQHNLCRRCAGDIFQSSDPLWRTRGSSSGGRFRCPSCRHEVVLDRHGVYGLQRNLLVENIIDIFRQQQLCRPENVKSEQPQQLTCEDHEDEKLNIYCLSCQTPTCSMCKVFGQHKGCEVVPLSSVYTRQKTELSDGIAALVASNDHIQALISQMEGVCQSLEENSQRQREQIADRFAGLVAILEERKQELVGQIGEEQDDRMKRVRALIRQHSEQLEAAVALVESALRAMEEPHMAPFVQGASGCLERMAAAAANAERPQLGYETMSHFVIDTDDVADVLRNIDFSSSATGGDDQEGPEQVGQELEQETGGRH